MAFLSTFALSVAAPAVVPELAVAEQCDHELVVLGAGQDAGAPQIGNADDDGPRLLPSSLGLIDRTAGARYLFDATPAITEQLAILDAIEPPKKGLGIDGIFLTHAHIGHYFGLAYLGREAAGAKGVPVYAQPKLAKFLRNNGPWNQLVELGNIELTFQPLVGPVVLSGGGGVAAQPVPHRQEYSRTVGFMAFSSSGRTILYLPDIDGWDEWKLFGENSLRKAVGKTDYAFIDGTFWDDNELPGRDMSEIPHPRVSETMDLLQDLPPEERAKVHFIHYNHTNPIRDPESPESKEVLARGFNIARRGMRFCLD